MVHEVISSINTESVLFEKLKYYEVLPIEVKILREFFLDKEEGDDSRLPILECFSWIDCKYISKRTSSYFTFVAESL